MYKGPTNEFKLLLWLRIKIQITELMFRNIGACKEFAETVQTCYGPNGMNKMVINHLEKLFVTNDAATIIRLAKKVYILTMDLTLGFKCWYFVEYSQSTHKIVRVYQKSFCS